MFDVKKRKVNKEADLQRIIPFPTLQNRHDRNNEEHKKSTTI